MRRCVHALILAPLFVQLACGAGSDPTAQPPEPDASVPPQVSPAVASAQSAKEPNRSEDGGLTPGRALLNRVQRHKVKDKRTLERIPPNPDQRSVLGPSEAVSIDEETTGLRPRVGLEAGTTLAASVTWPVSAEQPFRVTDDTSGARVAVRLIGANAARAEVVDGYASYPGAVPDGGIVFRATADGTEDFVYFERAPQTPDVAYALELTQGIAGLRLVGSVLEMLDATGTPRLRMGSPFLVGADGVIHQTAVTLEGCSYDSNPAAPWGRPVVAPGLAQCTIRARWNAEAVVWPAVLDPSWTSTGDLVYMAEGTRAVLLKDGRVLNSGGLAQLYDPATGTWAVTGTPIASRISGSLNLLPDGRALAAGGVGNSGWQNSAELYDPATGKWTTTGNLTTVRSRHRALPLPDGRIAAIGGRESFNVYLNSAEAFDPSTGTWQLLGAMGVPRSEFGASVLSDGKILVSGGLGPGELNTAEKYDPATDTWSPAGNILKSCREHQQVTLPDGRALIAAGLCGGNPNNDSALYDPSTNQWTAAGFGPRGVLATFTVVAGKALFAGGGYPGSSYASLFDPLTAAWLSTPPMAYERYDHTATLLNTGKVLVAGGRGPVATAVYRKAELYTPALPCTDASECATGYCVHGYCCDTACSGGCDRCDRPSAQGTCKPVPSGEPGDDPSCAPYLCNGTSNDCPVSCTASSKCVSTHWCTGGLCVPKKARGEPCGTDVECDSTFCRDGVCCNLPCIGQCDACTVSLGALADGTCTRIKGSGSPSCAPFVCDGSTSACLTQCTAQEQCISGYYCSTAGTCLAKKQIGAACQSSVECAYGNCADGICCDSACDQPCDRCNATGSKGTCIQATWDYYVATCDLHLCNPASKQCPTTCMGDTECSGLARCVGGDCVPKLTIGAPCTANSECASGTCVDDVCCDSFCSGACDVCSIAKGATADGKCTRVAGAPGEPSCAPYVCTASSAYCPYACSSNDQCAAAYQCVGSKCVPKLAQGATCTTGSACLSGFCSDGVCCDLECSGGCETCVTTEGASQDGTCTPIPGPGTPTCLPYLCTGTTGACPTGCPDDNSCAEGLFCSEGECIAKKPKGTSCGGNQECDSNHCVDGVCCDAACTQKCAACNQAGKLGTCVAVTGAPVGTREPCPGEGACMGLCDGIALDTCKFPPATTVCAEASCTDSVAVAERRCDGLGECLAGASSLCGVAGCEGPLCAAEVDNDAGHDAPSTDDAPVHDSAVADGAALQDGAVADPPLPLQVDDSAGCGCRVEGTPWNRSGAFSALAIAALGWRRRRGVGRRKLGAAAQLFKE